MKSNKGFTLIELLAVIVILAIIALIATPMVLNTIDDARRGAAQSSAYAYVSAVETRIAANMLSNTAYSIDAISVTNFAEVKGDKPQEVSLSVSNAVVTGGTIKVNGYTFNYDGKTMTLSE